MFREQIAAAIAAAIGNGMSEKYGTHADAAIAVFKARLGREETISMGAKAISEYHGWRHENGTVWKPEVRAVLTAIIKELERKE